MSQSEAKIIARNGFRHLQIDTAREALFHHSHSAFFCTPQLRRESVEYLFEFEKEFFPLRWEEMESFLLVSTIQ
jgi:hypothetical protein